MYKNKSYLPKYNIQGFDNYYINDMGEVINKRTNNFIGVNRDKGTAWHYYVLVNIQGKSCKVGLDKIIKTPYFVKGKENTAIETTLKEIGFL